MFLVSTLFFVSHDVVGLLVTGTGIRRDAIFVDVSTCVEAISFLLAGALAKVSSLVSLLSAVALGFLLVVALSAAVCMLSAIALGFLLVVALSAVALGFLLVVAPSAVECMLSAIALGFLLLSAVVCMLSAVALGFLLVVDLGKRSTVICLLSAVVLVVVVAVPHSPPLIDPVGLEEAATSIPKK